MSRAPLLLVLALSSIVLGGCNREPEQASTEPLSLIPAEFHGVYGRTATDTPGLVVGATGLEFSEMKLTIHEGKLEGDTVRIERATLAWAKLEPKVCSGTLARQGDRLLMSLYEVGGEQGKCEPLLDADWFHWEPLDQLPDQLQGRYNVLSIAAKELRLELGWFEAKMITNKIYRLPGSNDERVELLVDEGRVVHDDDAGAPIEDPCVGVITLEDGWLSTEFWAPKRFEPKHDEQDPLVRERYATHTQICADWQGRAQKFEVSLANLPKSPIAKRDVSLTITEAKVVLDSPALRCEQELWQTESVSARPGLFGGERMTLGKAEPTTVSAGCRVNMRIWCERAAGNDSAAIDASATPSEEVAMCLVEREHELCPESITVQTVSDVRYKLGVEPRVFNEIACVDTTGDFSIQKK